MNKERLYISDLLFGQSKKRKNYFRKVTGKEDIVELFGLQGSQIDKEVLRAYGLDETLTNEQIAKIAARYAIEKFWELIIEMMILNDMTYVFPEYKALLGIDCVEVEKFDPTLVNVFRPVIKFDERMKYDKNRHCIDESVKEPKVKFSAKYEDLLKREILKGHRYKIVDVLCSYPCGVSTRSLRRKRKVMSMPKKAKEK